MVSVDREGRRRMSEDVDLAARVGLDPNRRVFGSRVAKQRPDEELWTYIAVWGGHDAWGYPCMCWFKRDPTRPRCAGDRAGLQV